MIDRLSVERCETIHITEPENAELDDSSLIDPPPDDMLVDMVELMPLLAP